MKTRWAGLSFGVVLLASAQQTHETFSFTPTLKGLTYPTLARQARIQGTVRLAALTGEHGKVAITVSNGHPILVGVARQNLEQWQFSEPLQKPVMVSYVFAFTETGSGIQRRLRGDAFDRFFLRLFRRSVYKEEYHCKDSPNPIKVSQPAITEFTEHVEVKIIIQGEVPCL